MEAERSMRKESTSLGGRKPRLRNHHTLGLRSTHRDWYWWTCVFGAHLRSEARCQNTEYDTVKGFVPKGSTSHWWRKPTLGIFYVLRF